MQGGIWLDNPSQGEWPELLKGEVDYSENLTSLLRQSTKGFELRLTLNADETRLILAGLFEYRKNLLKTIETVHDDMSRYEDEAFAYGELRQIAQFLFDYESNHADHHKIQALRAWSDNILDR